MLNACRDFELSLPPRKRYNSKNKWRQIAPQQPTSSFSSSEYIYLVNRRKSGKSRKKVELVGWGSRTRNAPSIERRWHSRRGDTPDVEHLKCLTLFASEEYLINEPQRHREHRGKRKEEIDGVIARRE
jgi:hypothetical protein